MRFGRQFETFVLSHRPIAVAIPVVIVLLVVAWETRHRLMARGHAG
jgi:hypothetical protein